MCRCYGLLLCLAFAGCTKVEGPERFHVSGEITFDGRPVPFGMVVFDPDTTAGNSGPQGVAEIQNGRFDTNSTRGRGVVGGPMIVKVDGFSSLSTNEFEQDVPLFHNYTMKLDLPRDNSVQNIEVPSEAGISQKGKKSR